MYTAATPYLAKQIKAEGEAKVKQVKCLVITNVVLGQENLLTDLSQYLRDFMKASIEQTNKYVLICYIAATVKIVGPIDTVTVKSMNVLCIELCRDSKKKYLHQ